MKAYIIATKGKNLIEIVDNDGMRLDIYEVDSVCYETKKEKIKRENLSSLARVNYAMQVANNETFGIKPQPKLLRAGRFYAN